MVQKTKTKPRADNPKVRVNIVLPYKTLKLLDSMAPPYSRSAFLNQLILSKATSDLKSKLIDDLKKGYLALARENQDLAEEWAFLEHETARLLK
ncbi:hypothetical protein J7M23_00645 [Candidatus Sumerlaeota bacterium]|nr:hypothetical protein [Candidatus Sumerlaeota bacterium]